VRPGRQRGAVRRAGVRDPPTPARSGRLLVSTIVLSLNYNLRRLFRSEPARTSGTPDGGGVLRSIYRIVYEPQDRLIERVARRRRYRPSGRTLALFHNLGLATQHTAAAVCLLVVAAH
jgi:hypothetical protein